MRRQQYGKANAVGSCCDSVAAILAIFIIKAVKS
jgi:hypothetical protein